MKLSARGHYGLIAMTYLAQHGNETPISVKTIAEQEHIPEAFLKQIFHKLRKAGLVTSVRGARGGVRLTRHADQMTAGEIVRVLEGPITPVDCLEANAQQINCDKMDSCATKIVCEKLKEVMVTCLNDITLDDILDYISHAADRERAAPSGRMAEVQGEPFRFD